MARSLTAKQEAFAVELARGKPAAEAYRATYDASKMSDAAIHVESRRLRNHPAVTLRVNELSAPAVEKVRESVKVDSLRTLFENAKLSFSDIRLLFDAKGKVKPPHEWDDDTAAAVASYKINPGEFGDTIEVKLWDKGAALDRLGRHFGMYEKDNRQKAQAVFDGLPREQVKAILEALARGRGRPLLG